MYKINRLFFTILQFLLLIDDTKQAKFQQTKAAFKAISNTITVPLMTKINNTIKTSSMMKTIGKTINTSIFKFNRKKHMIQNKARGYSKKYFGKQYKNDKAVILASRKTSENFFYNRTLKQLSEPKIRSMVKETGGKMQSKDFRVLIKKSAEQMKERELRKLLKATTNQMGEKMLQALVSKIAKSSNQLPFLFVTGELTKLINFTDDHKMEPESIGDLPEINSYRRSFQKVLKMRTWKKTWLNTEYVDVNPDLKIAKIPNNNKLKVLSYNILAEGYKNTISPYDVSRGKRISDVILADKSDFVMLQEIDKVKESQENSKLDEIYNSIYVGREPDIDGLLTFYDKSRFNLVEQKHVYLDEEAKNYSEEFDEETLARFTIDKRIFHLMIFEDLLNDKKPVCVCNTHFYFNPMYDDTKYMQMVLHFNVATKFVNDFDNARKNTKMTPLILSGDYNTTPKANSAHIIYNDEPNLHRIEPWFRDDFGELFIKNCSKCLTLIDYKSMAQFSFKNAYSNYQKAISSQTLLNEGKILKQMEKDNLMQKKWDPTIKTPEISNPVTIGQEKLKPVIKEQEKQKSEVEYDKKLSPLKHAKADLKTFFSAKGPTIKNKRKDYYEMNKRKGFPEFTNYTKKFRDTLDHIFYNKSLQLLQLRKLPTVDEMEKQKIHDCPNAAFPSDHLPIGAVFCYNDKVEQINETGVIRKK